MSAERQIAMGDNPPWQAADPVADTGDLMVRRGTLKVTPAA